MDDLVTAKTAYEHFQIPKATFYWLVRIGKIRYAHDDTKLHHQRPHNLRFRLSEVEADLNALHKP